MVYKIRLVYKYKPAGIFCFRLSKSNGPDVFIGALYVVERIAKRNLEKAISGLYCTRW